MKSVTARQVHRRLLQLPLAGSAIYAQPKLKTVYKPYVSLPLA
jgi:hypothetical protein